MLGVRNIRSLSHRVKLLDGRQVHLEEGGNLEAEKTLVFMPGSAFCTHRYFKGSSDPIHFIVGSGLNYP